MRQPVVLIYNIYAGFGLSEAKSIAERGYVGIEANTRGKRLSADAIEPFERDGKDAYHIIDWISKQPWCNGKIGMYGGSYLGFAQWSTAKYLHPALKTIVPQVAVGPGIDFPVQNGIFMPYILSWLHYVTDNKLMNENDFNNSVKWDSVYNKYYKEGDTFRSLDTLEGRPNSIFQRLIKHPSYDAFWKNMTPQKKEFAKITIPILSTTGYWDADQLGAMNYYKQYHLWNKNPNYFLIIGPYEHFGAQGFPKKEISGYTIDKAAQIPIDDIIFEWLDHILKGSALPAMLKDKVNFQVMGTNRWKHVSSLDQMHNGAITFYLGNHTATGQYPLLKEKAKHPGYITQTINLADRNDIALKNSSRATLDSVLDGFKEKLVFASEPVETPFAISGQLNASIKVSINKKDFDLVLDLYEQTPDGKFLWLTEDVQRASYAKDITSRQLLTPGKIETIKITNTYMTSRQLKKGSRIIFTIGVNKNMNWQFNYGTRKDVSDESIKDAGPPLEIKWYNNSYIRLPVLK